VLRGVLGLLALVLVLVVGALVFLTSPAGESLVRNKALGVANAQLAGKLEAGGVNLGPRSLVLTDVKLYDPEGELVAEVERLEAHLALSPLAKQQVDVRSVSVERPRLYLVQDERGLNLSRAIAARVPKPEQPDTGPGTLQVRVREFRLEDGSVDFTARSPEGTREVRLDDLDAQGQASYAAATESLDVTLEATASMAQPVPGPVRLTVKAQGEQGRIAGDVDLSAPGLELVANGGVEGEGQTRAEVKRFSLAPETGRALLAQYPLAAAVSLTGTVAQTGDTVKVDLHGEAAGATAEVKGTLDVERLYTEGLTARVRGVDLSALMGGGPPTNISADLRVRGGGKSLETLDGEVDLTVPSSVIENRPLGPVELHATAKDGHYTLKQFLAQAPGARVSASGGGTLEDLKIEGRLVASDLALFANTLGRLGDDVPLPLSGSGALGFSLTGPARSPGISLSGSFASLAYADSGVEELSVQAQVPDVTQPLTADLELKAAQVRAGGRTYSDVSTTLATQGRALSATVSLREPALLLSLRGTVDEDAEGLALSALTLRYPEATWALRKPTALRFGGGHLLLEPLTLTSGPQALTLALDKKGNALDARTDLKAFDLSRLPRAFLPESLVVEGRLTGNVSARGTLPKPDVSAKLALEGGRYQQYADVGLELDASYVRDQARGTFSATAPAGRLSAKFNVPVEGLRRRTREAVDLTLTLERVDIGPALRMAGQPESASGLLSGALTLRGRANDPRLELTLEGSNLNYWGTAQEPVPVLLPDGVIPPELRFEPLGFTFTARSDDKDGTLGATLALKGLSTQDTPSEDVKDCKPTAPDLKAPFIELKTPFTLGALLARTPSATEAMRQPVKLVACVDGVPLSRLHALGLSQAVGGTVTLAANLSGPPLAPLGTLKVKAQGLKVERVLAPTDGTLTLDSERARTHLALGLERNASSLVSVNASFQESLDALQDPDTIGWVPFSLKARAGPVPLHELPGMGAEPALSQKVLPGVLSFDLEAQGTLNDPKVDLTAALQHIGVLQLRTPGAGQDFAERLNTCLRQLGTRELEEVGNPEPQQPMPECLRQLGVNVMQLGQARLAYSYADARSRVDTMLASPNGGSFRAHGEVRQELSLPALQRDVEYARIPLDIQLDAKDFDLGFLSGSMPAMVRSIGGIIMTKNASVTGTVGAPTFGGDIIWDKGQLALEGYGDYRNIRLELLGVSNEGLQQAKLFVMSGTGKMDIQLSSNSKASGVHNLKGTATADKFPLVYDDQLIALLDLKGEVDGRVSSDFIHMRDITISEAHAWLPEAKRKDVQDLEAPDDIVLVRNGEPVDKRARQKQEEAAASANSGTGGAGTAQAQEAVRRYLFEINAPRNIWVHGSDVNAEIGLSPSFNVEYANALSINGEVRMLQGWVEVMGRRFDVQNNSVVQFTGPAKKPYINVTAEHKNERAGVTVFVTIRGQGTDFTLKPTSDPPLPETEIYTLLATGRRQLKAGSGASMNPGQVASVLGGVLASQARKALAAKLPLDVFSIETGEAGLADTRLEVGTYLTRDLYLGYTGRLPGGTKPNGRENSNAVRLEYQFSNSWGFEVEAGDVRQGADVIWSKEY
jgi:translocation and assembly module TamB